MRHTLCALATGALTLAASSPCAAADQMTFSGFGTLGMVHSSERNADFVASGFVHSGAGYSHRWAASVDSRLGVQLDAPLTEQLAGVVQVVSELRADGSYRPRLEWANLRYEFTPTLQLRVGRFAMPTYLQFETRKIGFAMPWVRPPADVYNLLPVSYNDGLQLDWQTRIGAVRQRLRLHGGRADSTLYADIPDRKVFTRARDIRGLSSQLEYGDSTLHFGYSEGEITIPYVLANPNPAIAQYGVQMSRFASLGASHDASSWFVNAEVAMQNAAGVGRRTGWYVLAGMRYGDWTPFAGYARMRQNTPPLLPAVRPQNQQTLTAGLRWDLAPRTDIKLQYERLKNGDGNAGPLINLQPGFRPGGRTHVISVALDFIF